MRAVTIRDAPEETRNELAARAARSGRSLQEFLRQSLIELAAKPSMSNLLDEVSQRKERTGSRLSAEHIIAMRNADRR